jgi:DNA-binding transcriptional MerR regulator
MNTRPLRPVDVAAAFGRSSNWLRQLEKRGVVPRAPRDFSGRRVYTSEDIAHIRQILERRYAPEGSAA